MGDRAACVRDAVEPPPAQALERRSWSHPQEPTGDEWWADVLADPRARKRERRTDLAVKRAFYRLAHEKREIILVACSKCDLRGALAAHPISPPPASAHARAHTLHPP